MDDENILDIKEEKHYRAKEILEELEIPRTTLNDWLKNLEELMEIERDNKNHRVFTEEDLKILKDVKSARDKDIPFSAIKEALIKYKTKNDNELAFDNTISHVDANQIASIMRENFNSVLQDFKKDLIQELKDEIRKELKAEFKKAEEQRKAENQKLVEYIDVQREQKKKSFLSKFFRK